MTFRLDPPPCKPDGVDCQFRYPGCQDHCPDMAVWKEKNAAKKAACAKYSYQYVYATTARCNVRVRNRENKRIYPRDIFK